jgi:hypothetical protein
VWGNVITNISKGRGLRPRGRDGGSGKLVAPLSEREREIRKSHGGRFGETLSTLARGKGKKERKKESKERKGKAGQPGNGVACGALRAPFLAGIGLLYFALLCFAFAFASPFFWCFYVSAAEAPSLARHATRSTTPPPQRSLSLSLHCSPAASHHHHHHYLVHLALPFRDLAWRGSLKHRRRCVP